MDENKDTNEEQTSAPLFENQSLQDSLSSLYNPPYSANNPNQAQKRKETVHQSQNYNDYLQDSLTQPSAMEQHRQAMKRAMENNSEPIPPSPYYQHQEPEYNEHESTDHAESNKTGFLAILALSLGVNLALLGLIQLFLSTDGKLSLEWNSTYWFLYFFLSIPLLYLGYRKAQSLP